MNNVNLARGLYIINTIIVVLSSALGQLISSVFTKGSVSTFTTTVNICITQYKDPDDPERSCQTHRFDYVAW